jgi:hypothetical protein
VLSEFPELRGDPKRLQDHLKLHAENTIDIVFPEDCGAPESDRPVIDANAAVTNAPQ